MTTYNATPASGLRATVATVRYRECMVYLATPDCDAIQVERPTLILAPGMRNLWRQP